MGELHNVFPWSFLFIFSPDAGIILIIVWNDNENGIADRSVPRIRRMVISVPLGVFVSVDGDGFVICVESFQRTEEVNVLGDVEIRTQDGVCTQLTS